MTIMNYLTLLCVVGVCQAYPDGATGGQCGSLSANCQNQTHGPPNSFQPNHRFTFRDRGPNDNIKDITFENLEEDGNLIGYAFQIRDFGERAQGVFPRGYMTLQNLTYDRIFPCPGYDEGVHSNGLTHANATKGKIDIDNGQTRNEVSFAWDDQIPGGVQDTPTCGKVVATIMGYDGHWFPDVVSDCFINCDVEGCTNGTVSRSVFM